MTAFRLASVTNDFAALMMFSRTELHDTGYILIVNEMDDG